MYDRERAELLLERVESNVASVRKECPFLYMSVQDAIEELRSILPEGSE